MIPQEVAFALPWGALAGLRVPRPGAPRVIALHGWLDNAASFEPLLPHLDGLDVLLLDLPGHGRSAHLPAGTEYALTTHLHAVLDAADALGWDDFALLGHSMGAAIATLVAAAVPVRVQRLFLIETLGPLSEDVSATATRLQQAVAAARALPGKSLRVFPDLSLAVRARIHASRLDEASARRLVERGTRAVDGGHVWSSDPRLTLPSAQRLTDDQVADLLAAITCPVRAMFADPAQPYFPAPQRQARLAALPQVQASLHEGGHHLHMDQPALVGAAVAGFLAG